ncbi:hypothetical protein [Nocardia sp. CC227C]|uniref:hypothetical protein n=1 Tax=Nocardia sp. CC227C TaxID=3044562 RepID=UPI00278C14E2|nr:hypothetical protein [Nocardia sp. CC227C]
MSKTGRPNYRRAARERSRKPKPEKHIVIEEVQHQRPDLQKLSRAMIAMGIRTQATAEPNSEDIPSGSASADVSDGKEADNDNE